MNVNEMTSNVYCKYLNVFLEGHAVRVFLFGLVFVLRDASSDMGL